jgi:hypothetical protein
MTYTEAIKDGFRLVNRNWQLVLVQISAVILSSIGFLIIVGIPLAIAFIIFGIDLTGLTDVKDILRIIREPSEIVSRYMGLLLIIITSFLLYIILVAMLGIYIFGGSIGIIGNAVRDKSLKFSMQRFFDVAKKLFIRMLGFTAVVGIIMAAVAFVLVILGWNVATLVSFAKEQDSTLALFLGTFFSLIWALIALALVLGILSINLYGVAALFFKDTGPVKSLKEAVDYLARHPVAFWLYTILFGGYLLATFLLVLISYPFTLIPVIGTILSFPSQIILYAFQTYLFLAVIAAIFNYYYLTEISGEPVVENSAPQGTEKK